MSEIPDLIIQIYKSRFKFQLIKLYRNSQLTGKHMETYGKPITVPNCPAGFARF
jgi:hypothetical protein